MSRKLFGDGTGIPGNEEVESSDKEYKLPEDRTLGLELFNRFTLLKPEDTDLWRRDGFESEVHTLESVIKGAAGKFQPKPIIDSLIAKLGENPESGDIGPAASPYITAVVQAMYNLDYNNFIIDIRDWPENSCVQFGRYLRGRADKQLTLNLYGSVYDFGSQVENCNFTVHGRVNWCGRQAKYSNFTLWDGVLWWCASKAEHSNFILHGDAGWCGEGAKHCSFTLHDSVRQCGEGAKNCNFVLYDKVTFCGGDGAENCTFDLMPKARIKYYEPSRSEGNKIRKLNDKGEVRTIATLWANLKLRLGIRIYM